MSWYNEDLYGEEKAILELALGIELEPDDEPFYYRPKEVE